MPDAPDLPALWHLLERRWPENRIAPSLDRIAALTDLLGSPQRSFGVVHVAGTNGKSSTARMVESLLRSFGLRTGLFTSPHLTDPRERICLDGEPVDGARLLDAWNEIAPYVDLVDERSRADGGPEMSFFEVMTGLAFAVFADAPVDVAVVEVGLGGTWDSTNVVDGSVAVVTPIGMDHLEYLGDSIESIAENKAGIIKPGCVAVLAAQVPAVERVLLDRCVEMGATVARAGREFGILDRQIAVGGQVLSVQGLHARYDDVLLPLFGAHQAHNAACALAAAEAFLRGVGPLDADLVRSGFAQVTSPGRLEVVRSNPTVLLDAAHNAHGAHALAAALVDSFEFSSLVAVVGVLADKDAAGILEALAPVVDHVIVTQPRSPRAYPVGDLAAIARDLLGEHRVDLAMDVSDAIEAAVALCDEHAPQGGAGVLVTGSVVLVGQARALLRGTGV